MAVEAADGVIVSGSPRDAWADTPDVLEMLTLARQIVSGGSYKYIIRF